MPIINTTIGEVNIRGASAKISIFHSPKDGTGEKYISVAAKAKDSIEQRGAASFFSSVTGLVQEVGGRGINCLYSVKSNEVLKVFVKINPGYGKMEKTCCFFLRVREGAAYRLLKINTVKHHSVVLESALIEGCFDMLTVDEAIAEGVKVRREFTHLFNPDVVSAVISSHTILQREKKSSVTREVIEVVNQATGEQVSIVNLKKRRRAISI